MRRFPRRLRLRRLLGLLRRNVDGLQYWSLIYQEPEYCFSYGRFEKGKMKAVHWEGTIFSVTVKDTDIPKLLTNPLDAIFHLTSSAVCRSDLHTYHGRASL
jgi:hypothetical protein